MTPEQLVTRGENPIQTTKNSDSHYLSSEETRQILTPFAFEIDKSLFGIALAAPWKRGHKSICNQICELNLFRSNETP